MLADIYMGLSISGGCNSLSEPEIAAFFDEAKEIILAVWPAPRILPSNISTDNPTGEKTKKKNPGKCRKQEWEKPLKTIGKILGALSVVITIAEAVRPGSVRSAIQFFLNLFN